MSFKSLVCAVSVQRQEIKQALASIPYFETWDSEAVAECCRVSSVAEYPADAIILGPGTGTSHTVYFVLDGVCKMVQNLLIEVQTKSRQKTLYKLHGLLDSKTSHSDSTNGRYSSRLFDQKQLFQPCEEVKIPDDGEQGENGVPSEGRGAEAPGPEAPEDSNRRIVNDDSVAEREAQNESEGEIPREVDGDPQEKGEENADSGSAPQAGKEGSESPEESESRRKFLFEADHHLKILEECKKRRKETSGICKKDSLPEKPKNAESFFVQTGLLYKGACFGLEKCQTENFIMSTVKVKCLKIPRRFLFKHNPCYTWNRIRLFHCLNLPKEEEILERLRSDRMWIRERQRQSSEIVSSRNIPNYTSISEVPYSVRLSEVRLNW